MKTPQFNFSFSSDISGKLASAVTRRLEERGASSEGGSAGDSIDTVLANPSPELKNYENLAFQILHRQFEGYLVPGLPLAVGAARSVFRRFARLKRWIPN